MNNSHLAGSSKAQLKIQQTAFMLVALTIFFAIILLVYFTVSIANLKFSAEKLKDEEARAIVRQLAGSPELSFTASSDCSSCIDLDKAFQLKGKNYENLWNLNYLYIERTLPVLSITECTPSSYPENCGKITLIDINTGESFSTKPAFVTLVHWDGSLNNGIGGYKYELGRIHASAK